MMSWDNYRTVSEILNDRNNRYIELAAERSVSAQILATMKNADDVTAIILTRTTTARLIARSGFLSDKSGLRFAMNRQETLAHIDEAIDQGATLIVVEATHIYDGTRFTLLSEIGVLSETYPEIRFVVLTDFEDAQLPSPASTRLAVSQESSWFFTDTVARLIKVCGVPILDVFRARQWQMNCFWKKGNPEERFVSERAETYAVG